MDQTAPTSEFISAPAFTLHRGGLGTPAEQPQQGLGATPWKPPCATTHAQGQGQIVVNSLTARWLPLCATGFVVFPGRAITVCPRARWGHPSGPGRARVPDRHFHRRRERLQAGNKPRLHSTPGCRSRSDGGQVQPRRSAMPWEKNGTVWGRVLLPVSVAPYRAPTPAATGATAETPHSSCYKQNQFGCSAAHLAS